MYDVIVGKTTESDLLQTLTLSLIWWRFNTVVLPRRKQSSCSLSHLLMSFSSSLSIHCAQQPRSGWISNVFRRFDRRSFNKWYMYNNPVFQIESEYKSSSLQDMYYITMECTQYCYQSIRTKMFLVLPSYAARYYVHSRNLVTEHQHSF